MYYNFPNLRLGYLLLSFKLMCWFVLICLIPALWQSPIWWIFSFSLWLAHSFSCSKFGWQNFESNWPLKNVVVTASSECCSYCFPQVGKTFFLFSLLACIHFYSLVYDNIFYLLYCILLKFLPYFVRCVSFIAVEHVTAFACYFYLNLQIYASPRSKYVYVPN